MPEDQFKHIRVRPPEWFSKFRVISKRSHLSSHDQKIVRRKIGSKKALYTVGKFKRKYKDKAPKGKKGKPLAWGLQKIMLKKPKGGKTTMTRKSKPKKGKKQKKKKKWGKIGAPHSEKRKGFLAKIRKKRGR